MLSSQSIKVKLDFESHLILFFQLIAPTFMLNSEAHTMEMSKETLVKRIYKITNTSIHH